MLRGVWHAVENFEGPQLQSMLPRVVIERDPVVASVCVRVCVYLGRVVRVHACACVSVCVAVLKLPVSLKLEHVALKISFNSAEYI